MGALLSYSLVGGLFMLVLYLAYRVFLARENQHGFNRGILLLIYAISFSMPIFISLVENYKGSTTTTYVMGNIEVVSGNVSKHEQSVWWTILLLTYCIGMLFVIIKSLKTWYCLSDVIRKGEKLKKDDYTLVITNNEKYAPFSWLNYIVVSRNDYQDNYDAITAHELKHVASRHWLDLIIAQVVCIINWFNPVAWLMRDELMLVHEYQADMAVIDNGNDPQEYQMLLIKKAVGSRFPSLANSLNHSKLKKRITMMYQSKSGAGRKLKALALVPMLLLALGVVSIPAVNAAVSTIESSTISTDKGSENSSQNNGNAVTYKVTNINNDGKITTVTISGTGVGNNLSTDGGTFKNNGKKYNDCSVHTALNNGIATIKVGFPFSGELKNASMTLKINGQEIPFDLANYTNESGAAGGSISSIVVNGNSSVVGDLTIFIDGEEVTEAQMNALNPETIESITVDKKGKMFIITTKK